MTWLALLIAWWLASHAPDSTHRIPTSPAAHATADPGDNIVWGT
jgi:hypothetical protein